MTPNKEATWIDVWFREGAGKCVYSEELIEKLDIILNHDPKYHSIDKKYQSVIKLQCIDGVEITVRSTFVTGYYVNKIENRERRFAWERVLEKQEKDLKEDWE